MARTKKPILTLPDGTLVNPAICEVCGTKVARKGDLTRHKRRHLTPEEKLARSYTCPYEGCNYSNLQKSNVNTHIRTWHTMEKIKCPSCDFETPDPGSLTRHRKRRHEYVPERRRPRNPGNGPPVDSAQPHIIIETPATYSRSTSETPSTVSSDLTSSLGNTCIFDTDSTQSISPSPSSHDQVLPNVMSSRYRLPRLPASTRLIAFPSESDTASANYTRDGNLPPISFPTARAFELPSVVASTSANTGIHAPEPSYPVLLRRRVPLALQDMLSDENQVYWERHL
ncbi:hypothetical protein C8R42DRAFT_154651 [Lentinula raphanica]|nr:hypothetical protein C8R42DRAFT_154651 [Lentinula raphanica]